MTETFKLYIKKYKVSPLDWKKVRIPYLREWGIKVTGEDVQIFRDGGNTDNDYEDVVADDTFGNRISTEDVELEVWIYNPNTPGIATITVVGWGKH